MTASFLTKHPEVKPLFLIRASIAFVSSLTILITVLDEFWMFVIACFMFGFLTGLWIASTTPFLVQLLGILNINKALGLLTFVQGRVVHGIFWNILQQKCQETQGTSMHSMFRMEATLQSEMV